MKKLVAALFLGLLASAAAFATAPAANAADVLRNGISMNGIALNGLPSDGLIAGVMLGELNGVAVEAVILPAAAR